MASMAKWRQLAAASGISGVMAKMASAANNGYVAAASESNINIAHAAKSKWQSSEMAKMASIMASAKIMAKIMK